MGNHYCSCDGDMALLREKNQANCIKGQIIVLCEKYAHKAQTNQLIKHTPPAEDYVQFIMNDLPLALIDQKSSRILHLSDESTHKPKMSKMSSLNELHVPSIGSNDDLTPHKKIISDLENTQHPIFRTVLDKHMQFFEKVFYRWRIQNLESIDTQEKRTEFETKVESFGYPTCSPLSFGPDAFSDVSPKDRNSQLKQKELKNLLKIIPIETIRTLVLSIVGLFAMLKCYVASYYKQVLKELFPKRNASMVEYSQVIQEVIQRFIFRGSNLLRVVMTPLLERYYEASEGASDRKKTPDLDVSLMPNVYDRTIYEYSKEYRMSATRSMFDVSNNSSSYEMQLQQCEFTIDKMMQCIKRTEALHENIPYNQTFDLLLQMIREPRYIKKLRLIEALDQLIVDLYLFQRPTEEINKYIDTIHAEDNKLEILMFVLFKFQQQYGNRYSLQKDLLNHIRFMFDYNEVLNYQVKYIHTQCYQRFYQVLEMMIEMN